MLVCGSVQSCRHGSVAQGLLGRLLFSAAGSTVDRTMICLRKVKKHPILTSVVSSSYIVIFTIFPSDLLHKYLPHNSATVYFQHILYMQASSSWLSFVRFAWILVSHTWNDKGGCTLSCDLIKVCTLDGLQVSPPLLYEVIYNFMLETANVNICQRTVCVCELGMFIPVYVINL